ncbi:hypothetical protein [Infirmifilum sp. SLHALR2]|nr:MAG: hypothetical protein B7L53_03055 [Thermofilum sp. NZ13]
MDELSRIVFWVWRIGESEKSLVEISKNVEKAREVLELLQKYSLVDVKKKGRIFLVSLSDKGFGVYKKIREIREIVGLEPESPPRIQPERGVAEPQAEGLEPGGLPSFLVGNPWLGVLAKRGRERLGL